MRVCRLAVLAWVCAGLGCGGSDERAPATVGVAPAASVSAETPPEGCAGEAIAFRPAVGARYAMTVEGSDRTTPYRSELHFSPRGAGEGFVATEEAFSGPFTATQVGDVSAARLFWDLDLSGVPIAPPSINVLMRA